jgi:hypothetical protein
MPSVPHAAGAAPPIELWLVDPVTDARVRPLVGGDVLGRPFALEAVGAGGGVGSVEFRLNGAALRVENNAPFAAFGDAGGDFAAADVPDGGHRLEAHAYSGRQLGGSRLGSVTLAFGVGTTPPGPVPTPPGPPSDNVSGITIPPAFAGYRRVAFTEFPNQTRLGDGLHPDTLRLVQPRPDAARDCTYRDSSGRGIYCTRRTTYESGGLLRQWLHTENPGQSGIFHVPGGTMNYVSGLKWTLPDQSDFVVSVVARFDDIPGRKVAYLRWCGPRIGTPGYCEDNFPEARLDGGSCKGNAFHHHESRATQNGYALCIDLNDWHLYQMHVRAGRFVDFRLDGELIGHATQHVTNDASYFVFQSETLLQGQPIPFPHHSGWIEFDALAYDLPSD